MFNVPTAPAPQTQPADKATPPISKHAREHLRDQRALGILRRRDGWTIEFNGRWKISNGTDSHTSPTYMGIWLWWDQWYAQQPTKYHCEACTVELGPDDLKRCAQCDHTPNEREDYEVNWL